MGCGLSKQNIVEPKAQSKCDKKSKEKTKHKANKVDNFEDIEEDVNATCLDTEFPDPNSVEILEYTPPDNSKITSYKLEDTFWDGKRKLIPDYSALKKVDEHALKTPKDLKNDPDALVKYLLKGAATELEKVRVLVRWIVDNIAYDVAGRDTGNATCSLEGVVKSGKTICGGYANIFLMICQKASLECRFVTGQTKNYEERQVVPKSDHAWNQVRINGDWYLVDPTWCAGSVEDGTFNKRWNEEWFIVDPKAFIYNHLPVDDKGNISQDLQRIPKPFTSSQKWDALVEQSPLGYAFGFEAINDHEKNIQVTDSKLTLKYKCNSKFKLEHIVTIEEQGSKKLDSIWHMVFEKNGTVTAIMRFPRASVYIVVLGAKCKFEGDTDETYIRGFQYRVVNTGNEIDPFPGPYSWGESEDFLNAGFKVMQPVSPVITAENGLAKIKVKFPSNGIVPNLLDFIRSNSGVETNLNQYVYPEKRGRIATYYIQCPEVGEYRFTIFIKISKQQQHFQQGANILVISGEEIGNQFTIPPNISTSLRGPEPEFYKLGFTTNNHSTTVLFDKEKATLDVRKTKGVFITGKLISACDPSADEFITKDETTMECVFTVTRPRDPGFYWIKLYGGKDQYDTMVYIGAFCVPYMVPFMQK